MRGEEFSRLLKQFETCKGMEVQHKISELRSGFESTTQSYILLKKALSSCSNLSHAIWLADSDHPERMKAYFLEVRRDFNSYLPSVRALTDYMERLKDSEPSQELRKDYDVRAADIVRSPLGCFFRSLANYLLHHRGLPTGVVIKGVPGKQDDISYVRLDAKRLLEWNGWDSRPCAKKGKKYLLGLGEEVRVLEKLEEYHSIITGFYIWFHNELIQSHQVELDELEALRAKLAL